MTSPSSDEQQPWILSVRLDRLAGTATFVRSDRKQAVFEVGSSVDPTSSIVATTWVPKANAMAFETDRGDSVVAELPTVDDLAPLNGRPVVYLDQNQWSTLANVVHAPERLTVAEGEAAEALIDMAAASKVVLPLSAGHMSETCKWTNRDRRYALALTILKLSRGWQMRDPLELRRSEIRRALLARYRDEHPAQPAPFTLEPEALHGPNRDRGPFVAPADFPEDYALTFRAQTSIASAFDVMLDAEHIEVGPSPGWVERFQGFTDWLGAQPRDNRRLRHSRTDAFFLSDILNEVAAECPRAGITAEEMSDWTLNHSSDDISVMPSLGLFREAMREKLLNPGTRWEDNDLADLMYLTCGAGYSDHVVAERSFASQIDRAVRRLGRTPNVHRNLFELLAAL